ncbi:hypothetical protein [Aneurinibacillus uraniidurans]|uniref:hypothetical protein n=1 Tax=Aneurinibacillus uraniidurans TaxID=2966586 RepID=UPI002349B722|nr:hypothetical protein [Aneurinibacillus sp. B1]WCN39173.1 hypothetical protein PO771_07205 [Aneurinibacillus sp. B1]
MSDAITEALLEMHFHKAIVESFKTCFGPGFLRMLKPSPRKEGWVGFDQGWARTALSTDDLLDELTSTIANNKHSINKFYSGYFMQFKLVKKMTNKNSHSPKGYRTPYYRSEISLKPKKTTGLSQHETLLRLKSIKNTYVCYACPMLFDINEIYEEPDLDKLQIVPIDTAPSGWATGTKHHITFQTPDDTSPLWCSNPVK